jgi:Mce-associated membrane protein
MSTDHATATEERDANLEEQETDTDEKTAGTEIPKRGFGRIAVVLLAVLTVVAAGTAAMLGWKLHDARAVENAARQASEAARNYAVTLTSVSADSLESDFAAVLDGATGEFEDMYAESSEQLTQLLIDNRAQAEGVVVDSGIKSATETKVVVLLFIDQSVTNALVQEPRLDRSRVVMTMELVDGRWLASDVDLP